MRVQGGLNETPFHPLATKPSLLTLHEKGNATISLLQKEDTDAWEYLLPWRLVMLCGFKVFPADLVTATLPLCAGVLWVGKYRKGRRGKW